MIPLSSSIPVGIENRRKYQRFAGPSFLNRPVIISPLPPFFGSNISGRLIDLSAGGMGIMIDELIPDKTKLHVSVQFPEANLLESQAQVRRVQFKGRKFMIGIQFLELPQGEIQRIESLSNDYLDCETRLQERRSPICSGASCHFFDICLKPERSVPIEDIEAQIQMAFHVLDSFPHP